MPSFNVRLTLPALLAACGALFSPSTSQAQTVTEFNAVVAKYSVKSPAGGPKANPTAAVFVFIRKSKKLCWVEGGKLMSVEVVPTVQPDDKKPNGPTPPGEYLIGKRIKHAKLLIDWYKLYPRIEDNSGYYGYTAKTKTGRFAMGLHPGSVSLGCVTVKSSTKPYDVSTVWKPVRTKLDSSNLTYKKDTFSGLLYVEDK
jgi:hypothetical protein